MSKSKGRKELEKRKSRLIYSGGKNTDDLQHIIISSRECKYENDNVTD